MKLNPEGVKARKEHAKLTRQRVELRREDSGNASLAGRELDTVTAMACKAYIDALAVRIRNLGHVDGPLSAIRARVMTELLQGRNPLDLIKPRPRFADRPATEPPPDPAAGPRRRSRTAQAPAQPKTRETPTTPTTPGRTTPATRTTRRTPASPVPGYAGPNGVPAWTPDEADQRPLGPTNPTTPPHAAAPCAPSRSAPPPANLNLIIPIGTLLGWSTTPAQAGAFGLLDPDETQALAAAASHHPRTRWSITLTDPQRPRDRARPRPRPAPLATTAHRRPAGTPAPEPPPPATPPTPHHGGLPPDAADGPAPDADQAARLRHLIHALKIIFDPIAQDTCDHQSAENRYTPSRKLKDLIRARTVTCDAPGCNAQARYGDLDHTTPYPDGSTCQCNLGPKCRRHHRAKQAPGWHVEQPEPGTTRWTLPNGRTHTTTPTTYDS